MRGAFVIRLETGTDPAQGRFEGWVEELDSGKDQRFRSAEDLLRFLGQRFSVAFGRGPIARVTAEAHELSDGKDR
jgi:hypothetical protein